MSRPNLDDRCVIEPLRKGHDRSAFSCGVDALDRYLRDQAGQDARRNVATVFVAVESDSEVVHGFYTLSMAGVGLDLLPGDLVRKMPRYPSVPAVRLGRLAVHADAKGRGLGSRLLMDAMARSLQSEIAWAAMVVDANDEAARGFYRKFGFLSLLDDGNHLFLPRKTIEALL
jgi:ribosomal protein S18 acetylase RimI-like enzyme